MNKKNILMMLIGFVAMVAVIGSRTYLRSLEAEQAQMRAEVNEHMQDEEFRQQIDDLRESQQNLSQQISEMVGGNIAGNTAEDNAGTHAETSAPPVYYPNAFETVPEDVRKEYSEYVNDHVTLMGTLMFNSCMADVTGDGYDDICSSFFTGSGIVTSLIIVYDVREKQGYMLNDRMVYDYTIEGVEDGRLVVKRRKYCGDDEDLFGTVVFQDGGIYFDDGIETMGVPYKVIDMFGDCAVFLREGNTSSGDYLSTMDFDYVREFMFNFDKDSREIVHAVSADEGYSTFLMKIPYDEWAYLIEKVYMEEDISKLLENLDHSYAGDSAVYYDQADDCIYLESSEVTFGDRLYIMRSVSGSGDEYVITYDVYSGWQLIPDVYDRTVRVTIEKADNSYGYRLLSVK